MRGGGTGAFPTEIHNFSHNCALFVMVSRQEPVVCVRLGIAAHLLRSRNLTGTRRFGGRIGNPAARQQRHVRAAFGFFALEKLRRWNTDEGLLDERLFSPQYDRPIRPATAGRIPNGVAAAHCCSTRSNRTASAALPTKPPRWNSPPDYCASPSAATTAVYRRRYRQAADILQHGIRPSADHAEIARRVGLNRMLPETLFQSANGETVAGCLHRLRLERALALIESGSTVEAAMHFAATATRDGSTSFERHYSLRFGCEEVLMG